MTCGFCGSKRSGSGESCYRCGAPYAADPTRSLTEAIIGPIDQVFLLYPIINRAVAMGVSRKFDTLYTGPHAYGPDPGCLLLPMLLVLGIGGITAWMIGGITGASIGLLIAFTGISLLITLWVRGGRNARQAQTRLENNRRLMEAGQLLRGEVLETRQVRAARILLTYRFLTPDGRWLTDTASIPPVRGKMPPPPDPGTPLAIMYVDDTCYKAL